MFITVTNAAVPQYDVLLMGTRQAMRRTCLLPRDHFTVVGNNCYAVDDNLEVEVDFEHPEKSDHNEKGQSNHRSVRF